MLNKYRTPAIFLMIAQIAMQFAFAGWWALLNNYAVDTLGASGAQIGVIQSVREIPGLLAFTLMFWLVAFREQNFAVMSLFLLGAGIAITAIYPSLWWLGATTLLNSFGFHYYETLNQSLALQWIEKKRTPIVMGQVVASGAVAQLIAYGAVAMMFSSGKMAGLFPSFSGMSFQSGFMIAGGVTILLTFILIFFFPHFREPVVQNTKLQLHKRYWLYYALSMMQGSRRTIFTVFSGFMLVKIFKYSVSEVALLFFINGFVNFLLAPQLGKMIAKYGERFSFTLENYILIVVFLGYTLVAYEGTANFAWVAGVLFCIDGISNTLGISLKTYFQKIGDPADMAVQASVAFSINHLSSVFLPLILGPLWLISPSAVFAFGTCVSLLALTLARFVPRDPRIGYETTFVK
jgi:MFS family permease